MSKDKLEGEVGVAVLKKAIDLQKESATQLIQALPTPAPAASGSVGSNIDVKA